MFTKTVIGAVAAAGFALIAPTTALADTHAPGATEFRVVCGSQSFDVISPSGPSAAGQVKGSNMVAVLLRHGARGATLTNCNVFIDGEFIFSADLLLTPQR